MLPGPFGILWAGQSVSLIGDGVFLVAFTWCVAVEWRRPALLGVLLGVRILAELIALGLGGWVVDRLPRRTTVLAADGGRGVVLLALAAALHRPASTIELALLVAAFGVLTGLFRPALLAYVPEMVQRERLAAANSLFALSQQASVVLGPAIGAGIVGLGGAPTALRLDGVSFLIAALATVPLPHRRPASTTSGAIAQVAEGFRAAKRVGWVGGTILLFSLINIATISAERLALPRAAEERFGQLGGYGAMLVAIGAGAALAALVVGRSWAPREPGRTAYTGVLLFGVATAGFGIARGILAGVAIGLAFGFGHQVFELLWTTGLQQNVPDRLLGRISAVDQFGSFLFLPVSFAFGGLLVQSVDPNLVLIAAGLAGLAAAAIGLAVPALHQWRPFPAELAAPHRSPAPVDPPLIPQRQCRELPELAPVLAPPGAQDGLASDGPEAACADGCARIGYRGASAQPSRRRSQPMATSSVHLEIPASGAYLAVARATATGLAAQLHFTYDQIDDLRIAVDEACTQLMARRGSADTIHLAYHLDGDELCVEASVEADDHGGPLERDTFAWQILTALSDEVVEQDQEGRLLIRLRKSGGSR